MTREEIMNVLPHREAMLLLDEAENTGEGAARGSYLVTGAEWFLRGHFPGNPVVPGVILLEIMAQASCAMLAEEIRGKTPYYAGVDKARFRRMVRPGERIDLSVRLLRQKMNLYLVSGEARVGGELAASGEMSFTIR